MADEDDERFERFEDMVRRLTAMLVEQREFNLHIAGLLQEQREFNRQQVAINHRLETMITHMLQQHDNGRDAV